MKFNFDEIVDRSQNYAAKFQEAELHYGTNDVIPLWIADMDFRTAPCIVDAIKARADQGIFGYTWRTPKYFEAVAGWQEKRNGWRPDVEKMAFAPGVVPSMRMVLTMFTQPGDKILIQQPVYHPFSDVVLNTGRELVVSPLKRDDAGYYTVDFADFEEKARGCRFFILCNPHNPVAPSKTFNLAGLQSSTIVFNSGERKDAYVAELKRMDIARNNCFSLVATMEAYTHGEEWLEELLVYLSENMRFIRSFCAERLPELKPNTPEATYLCWIDARALGMDDETLKTFCVEKAGVALGYGPDFGVGGSGFLRLNAACPRATLEKALTQLERAVHSR